MSTTSAPTILNRTLRMMPLLSATATLTLAIMEPLAMLPFLSTRNPIPHPTLAIRNWWRSFVTPGFVTIIGLGSISLSSAILAAVRASPNSHMRKWYTAGSVAVVAHFLFGGHISQIIDGLVGETDGDGGTAAAGFGSDDALWTAEGTTKKELLKKWMRVHAVRTVVADLPALLFYWWAVVGQD